MTNIDSQDFLEKSKDIDGLCRKIKDIKETFDIIPGENAIIVIITCLDDQCSTVASCIKRKLRDLDTKPSDNVCKIIRMDEIYEMRLFGGLFLPNIKTFESLVPAAHHIPKQNGKLFVLNFSHIGYDSGKNKFGEFGRYGHEQTSASCGAIKGLYTAIIENKELPEDHDLKRLGDYLAKMVRKYDIRPSNGQDMLELTIRAYKEQIPWIKYQLIRLAECEQIDIVYLGGIEIDVSNFETYCYNDRFALLDEFFVEKGGNVKGLY